MAALGVGIVGAGFAAELHAVNYRPLVPSRVALAAVWSRTRTKAEAFAEQHGIPRVFGDVRRLVECPDVDVVDICTTTDSHHEIAIAAADDKVKMAAPPAPDLRSIQEQLAP